MFGSPHPVAALAGAILVASALGGCSRVPEAVQAAAPATMSAKLLMLWYFQDDDDPARLELPELSRAFDAYDENDDGSLEHGEFSRAARERRDLGQAPDLTVLRNRPPFELFLAVADDDADRALSFEELSEFYTSRDDAARGLTPDGRPDTSVAFVGEPAPDFTLDRLDGDGQVTLSDYVDDRPVALIFGSYT